MPLIFSCTRGIGLDTRVKLSVPALSETDSGRSMKGACLGFPCLSGVYNDQVLTRFESLFNDKISPSGFCR